MHIHYINAQRIALLVGCLLEGAYASDGSQWSCLSTTLCSCFIESWFINNAPGLTATMVVEKIMEVVGHRVYSIGNVEAENVFRRMR